MAPDPQQAVLFDLDGVLVDSRSAIPRCINHALAVHGFPERPEEALYQFIGPPLARAFAELTVAPVDSAVVTACVRSYRETYAVTALKETAVMPDVAPAVAALAQEYRLAVATSKPRVSAEPLLEALELREFFELVVGPEQTDVSEEKTLTIGHALRRLRVGRAVMIGDRRFDIAGAHAHGVPAIGVTWGIGSADELITAGADAIIDDPVMLPSAVEALMPPRARGHATSRPSSFDEADLHRAEAVEQGLDAVAGVDRDRWRARPGENNLAGA